MTDAECREELASYGYTIASCYAAGFVREAPLNAFGYELTDEGRARAHLLARGHGRTYQDEFGKTIDVDQKPRNEGSNE